MFWYREFVFPNDLNNLNIVFIFLFLTWSTAVWNVQLYWLTSHDVCKGSVGMTYSEQPLVAVCCQSWLLYIRFDSIFRSNQDRDYIYYLQTLSCSFRVDKDRSGQISAGELGAALTNGKQNMLMFTGKSSSQLSHNTTPPPSQNK